jgi:hypothetical protein
MTDEERVNNEENFEERAEYTRRLRKLLETEPPWGKTSPEERAKQGRELAEWFRKAQKPKLTLGQKLWLAFNVLGFAACVVALIIYAVFYPDGLCTIAWCFNAFVWVASFVMSYHHFRREVKKEEETK